jgi:tetratricopeptide (TPR) repeat protein
MVYFLIVNILDKKYVNRTLTAFIGFAVIACIYALLEDFLLGDSVHKMTSRERSVISTFGSSTYFAEFLVIVLPLSISWTLQHNRSLFQRAILGSASILILVLLILTRSRSAWIAAAIAFVLIVIYHRKRILRDRTVLIIAGVTITFLLIVFHQLILGRLSTALGATGESSLIRRTVFWNGAMQAFLNSPIVGNGFGTFEIILPRFRSPDYWMLKSEDIVPHAHNEFLEILAETGILGFICYAAILGLFFRAAVRIYKKSNPQDRITIVGLAIGVLGVLIDNLANGGLRTTSILVFFWALLGITMSFDKDQTRMLRWRVPMVISRLKALPSLVAIGSLILILINAVHTIRADQHAFRGSVYERLNQPDMALNAYEKALKDDPNKEFALFHVGGKYYDLGLYHKAIPHLQRLRELAPWYPKTNMLLGLSYFNTGQTSLGIQLAKEELALNTHPQNSYVLSVLYKQLKDQPEEMRTIEHTLETSVRGHTSEFLAFGLDRLDIIYTETGNWKRAFPLYGSLIEAFSDDRSVLKHVAHALAENGKFDQAREFYKKLMAEDPADSITQRRLDELSKVFRQ